ncbi:hypothetical protein CCMA1212_004956, partial [Trichoderma ghanense]
PCSPPTAHDPPYLTICLTRASRGLVPAPSRQTLCVRAPGLCDDADCRASSIRAGELANICDDLLLRGRQGIQLGVGPVVPPDMADGTSLCCLDDASISSGRTKARRRMPKATRTEDDMPTDYPMR